MFPKFPVLTFGKFMWDNAELVSLHVTIVPDTKILITYGSWSSYWKSVIKDPNPVLDPDPHQAFLHMIKKVPDFLFLFCQLQVQNVMFTIFLVLSVRWWRIRSLIIHVEKKFPYFE